MSHTSASGESSWPHCGHGLGSGFFRRKIATAGLYRRTGRRRTGVVRRWTSDSRETSAAAHGTVSPMHHTSVDSPVGELLLAADDTALRRLSFQSGPRPWGIPRDWAPGTNAVLATTAAQLEEYFAGERRAFDLPLGFDGTAFQQQVWRALLEIPYGETTSYGEIARRIGKPPSASRAVGLANGSNPIAIVVPCHRVIGTNGSLTGFGGGLERKRTLLDLEAGAAAQLTLGAA
jgi:methylated-DNA-[protein]-cysteine S-methyltransferase